MYGQPENPATQRNMYENPAAQRNMYENRPNIGNGLTSPPKAHEGSIEAYIAEMEVAQEQSIKIIMGLADMLRPILADEQPSPEGNGGRLSVAPNCELANRLQQRMMHAESIRRILGHLADRVRL